MNEFTTDGILLTDWKKLESMINDYVEENDFINEEKIRRKILAYLNSLSKRYGDKITILATKADYLHKRKLQENILHKAYNLAKIQKDYKNLVLIASSFIDLYDENLKISKVHYWINEISEHLNNYEDNVELENLKQWKNKYNISLSFEMKTC